MAELVVVKDIDPLREVVALARHRGLTVGFVPTMGALHEGHASLIRAARAETGFVVVSLFVNPTQFGPHEDLDRYPRTFEADKKLCACEGADLLFAPSVEKMYPPGFRTFVEVTGLQDGLCGHARPGHFRGVATIVLKLFNIVNPDVSYFGQKDAQQARLIQQMAKDLHLPVKVKVCPTVREADGLALSSRNRYLSAAERQEAIMLFQALTEAQTVIRSGETRPNVIRQLMEARIAKASHACIDYVSIVDADSLEPVEQLKGLVLLALAVRFGQTRLIDNLVVECPN